MAFALKCLIVFCVLSMASQGLSRCTFDEIEIRMVTTGRVIEGELEWKVTVMNTCKCFQEQITLSCQGFDPVKSVDPSLLQPQGNTCLLINGAALAAGATANFTYAGQPYIFRPVGSTVDPSCES